MYVSPRRTLCKGLDLAAKASGARHPAVVVVKEHAPAFSNSASFFHLRQNLCNDSHLQVPMEDAVFVQEHNGHHNFLQD